MLEELVRAWQTARCNLLTALADHDLWLKEAKKGGYEVKPEGLADLWTELSRAEAALASWRESYNDASE